MKTLHYQKHLCPSSNQWVVFLHGAGGSVQTWKLQIKALKDRFNLLAIDLRDHGKSKNIEPSADSYDFDLIAADILKVLSKEKIEKAHFITLSFGSVLMQALYKRKPGIVDQMVLIGGIFDANWMIKSFVHVARSLNIFLSYSSMYRIFSFLLMPKKRNQLARKVYQMQARKLSQEEYLKWLGLYSEFFTLLKSFYQQEISNEMLLLMGEDDYMFLPSAIRFTQNRPKAQLELIPKAGHICNIDQPDLVNLKIMRFLDTQKDLSEKPVTTVPSDTC
ncbi:alpha/beta fold hydrolase [Ekhidna sp. To15]|uniref:alpha/beta fold hydrolase n=1 Tax=Ekhidna sp. To15 TaxID=3395267 RepID=UPI003F528F21